MAKPAELLQRRRFDYEVLADMQCATFASEAYASTADLNARRHQIKSAGAADKCSKYRLIFRIPTLIGPGKFTQQTEIGLDTDVSDYPRNPPNSWIITEAPWSPHFLKNAPVCIGDELWKNQRGYVTLGHLVMHIARMLNWDEKGRGRGYVGWNGEAIKYHRRHYGDRPLDPSIVYPKLPLWLTAADAPAASGFEIISQSGSPADSGIEFFR
ncbi:hypothetical protein [Paractinoplanes lichenicola]|uniref:Uncharacterized protein n=1 Tax=Paractinoplanes lichenicola TaxID=2802976 RepID=A0ABS1VU84_9ACTN|nr:hypothetical protein [Actinoplanes lichenicola]MBL7258016.1 hypothetical protein [Actinoplanes lichenicola]